MLLLPRILFNFFFVCLHRNCWDSNYGLFFGSGSQMGICLQFKCCSPRLWCFSFSDVWDCEENCIEHLHLCLELSQLQTKPREVLSKDLRVKPFGRLKEADNSMDEATHGVVSNTGFVGYKSGLLPSQTVEFVLKFPSRFSVYLYLAKMFTLVVRAKRACLPTFGPYSHSYALGL